MAPAAALLPKLARAALRKRGLAQADIGLRWAAIVGDHLASTSYPEKLSPATGVLTVRVDGAAAIEIQHLEPVILERIGAFLGRMAVKRLKLVNGRLPPPRRARQPLPRVEDAAGPDGIADPELRAAIGRLGAALAARAAADARKKP